MSVVRSGRKGQPSGGTGSNVLAGDADHKAQAGLSTLSQAQAQKDGFYNSGEHCTFPYYFLVTWGLTR